MERKEEDYKGLEMTCLFANGLNAMIETQTSKAARGAESLLDLELYADLMESMSEIQEVDSRVKSCVDELVYEDGGFLGTYEDFSFCSTAQV